MIYREQGSLLQKNPTDYSPAGLEGSSFSGFLAQQELVNPAFFTVFDQFIAGGAAKGLKIRDGTWIGCQNFEGSAGRNVFQGLFSLENREGTIQPFCV